MKVKLTVSLGEEKREKIVEFETNDNVPDKKIFEEFYSQCGDLVFEHTDSNFNFKHTKNSDVLLCKFFVCMGNEKREVFKFFKINNMDDDELLEELWEYCDVFLFDCVKQSVEILER